ncbi:MAG: ComF family protein [Deltaproteobacteria bacterium]|jgi:ComF family protein|nr:ComF family protein [Deltaproteobacteria bacterium]
MPTLTLPAGYVALLARLGRGLLLDERRCAACLAPFAPSAEAGGAGYFCPACHMALPRRVAGHCPLCGEPAAPAFSAPAPCAACLRDAPPWEAFRFYGIYEGLLRRLILRAKFQPDIAIARALGELALPVCRELPVCDALVPMPQHPAKLRRRGCNQCQEMARPIARGLELPLMPQYLRRTVLTRPQTQLRRQERRADLSASFAADPDVRGKRILLLDDTMTTGTSLRFAARRLLQAGAEAVRAAVVARTSLHGSS